MTHLLEGATSFRLLLRAALPRGTLCPCVNNISCTGFHPCESSRPVSNRSGTLHGVNKILSALSLRRCCCCCCLAAAAALVVTGLISTSIYYGSGSDPAIKRHGIYRKPHGGQDLAVRIGFARPFASGGQQLSERLLPTPLSEPCFYKVISFSLRSIRCFGERFPCSYRLWHKTLPTSACPAGGTLVA